jgi:hypothetical protein
MRMEMEKEDAIIEDLGCQALDGCILFEGPPRGNKKDG